MGHAQKTPQTPFRYLSDGYRQHCRPKERPFSTLAGVDGPLKQLGQRIRDLRKERGWSQERFADVCGVHRTYMGHLERGEKNVSFNTLVRLSEALGISLPELLSDQGKRASKAPKKGKAITIGDDLNGIVEELNHQRETLEKSAGVLKDVANTLRTGKQHHH
jgi:transcriptional regulator with XRE-family HTH domain